ncbi:unnamed protein product [Closterium sp. NIES-54]
MIALHNSPISPSSSPPPPSPPCRQSFLSIALRPQQPAHTALVLGQSLQGFSPLAAAAAVTILSLSSLPLFPLSPISPPSNQCTPRWSSASHCKASPPSLPLLLSPRHSPPPPPARTPPPPPHAAAPAAPAVPAAAARATRRGSGVCGGTSATDGAGSPPPPLSPPPPSPRPTMGKRVAAAVLGFILGWVVRHLEPAVVALVGQGGGWWWKEGEGACGGGWLCWRQRCYW